MPKKTKEREELARSIRLQGPLLASNHSTIRPCLQSASMSLFLNSLSFANQSHFGKNPRGHLPIMATWPLAARAQQPGKLTTIGFVGSDSPDPYADRLRAFRLGLKSTGFVERQTVNH
jgi:hypothetical protein